MLNQFRDFEDQNRADLEYGDQLEGCKRSAERDTSFSDHSITGSWTPDED